MDFEFNETQKMLAASARDIAKKFPGKYWMEQEEEGKHPAEYWDAVSKAGFFGINIPKEYGGGGLGMTDLLVVTIELGSAGCGLAPTWYFVGQSAFGGVSLIRHGNEEQKKKFLPAIASGKEHWCMALTEPDAGSNTLNTATTAVKDGDSWVINGSKQFISEADIASHMMIITRTTPLAEAKKKTSGLSLILGDLPDPHVDVAPIPKLAINYSHTCTVGFSDYRVPLDYMLVYDNGWYYLLDTLNTERMLFTAGAIGIGRAAISKAVEYSKTRNVFGDTPIGAYQALSFPVTEAWCDLACAELMMYKAATIWDSGAPYTEVGGPANMGKIIAVEAGGKATYWAMQVFGGYGYTKEYDVERWFREMQLIRLAPISQQMALNYASQYVVGFPRTR
jgi:acyl-CoA dehydrogenase